jgi:hypothetical protein
VLRGPPGIGKSALLHELAAAEDFLVLRAQGLESEFPLAFAGVHQLLRPLLPLTETLPLGQAHALRVAFEGERGPCWIRWRSRSCSVASGKPFATALSKRGLVSSLSRVQLVQVSLRRA